MSENKPGPVVRMSQDPPVYKSAEELFVTYGEIIAGRVHDMAKEKGWWKGDRHEAELIALHHSELSEALEALRHGNPPSEKIPQFSGVEEEFADVVIRIMDHCKAKGYRLFDAINAKIEFNAGRAHRHGGKAL
jgi:NTP pyrophosphatase (non-canonical NTP hydrolase)